MAGIPARRLAGYAANLLQGAQALNPQQLSVHIGHSAEDVARFIQDDPAR